MKQNNNQNKREQGFAHLLLIATVVVVVAALAFGGWWVWERNQKNNKASNQTSQNNTQSEENGQGEEIVSKKVFNCKNKFTVEYPEILLATITDADQCVISNVGTEEMSPVGPLPPNQLGLFFGTQSTNFLTSTEYLNDYIERSQEDASLALKSQEEITLDNGSKATWAKVFGGHPVEYDFYLFIYVKDGTAITTSYPVNSDYKEVALSILKSIN